MMPAIKKNRNRRIAFFSTYAKSQFLDPLPSSRAFAPIDLTLVRTHLKGISTTPLNPQSNAYVLNESYDKYSNSGKKSFASFASESSE
jgi:hypothetical protein